MTQQLLIGGSWVDATSGRTFEQAFPFTGETVGSAAAAGREDARAAADAAWAAFGEWSRSAPAQRREVLGKAADILSSRAEEIAGIVTEETGGVFGWGMFNVSAGRRDAARGRGPGLLAHGRGHPLRRARQARHGGAPAGRSRGGDRALERAGDPGHAGGGDTARLRQHGRAQGLGDLPPHARRRGPRARRRRAPRRGDQLPHPRPGRRRRRGRRADRPSGDAPDQLHRLDPGRAVHRRERRTASQARAARARRQGPDGRAGRRRSGSRRGRGELRRLLSPGPDLHVDRADRGRPRGGRRLGRPAGRPGLRAARRRPTRARDGDRADDQRGRAGAGVGLGGGRGRQGAPGRCRGGEADGRLLPAHGAGRGDAGDAHLLRGVVRPARLA